MRLACGVVVAVVVLGCILLYPLESHDGILKSRRLVINCFPYNGESHLLKLKLLLTNSFTDYYIITEGMYSHTGIEKDLTFDYQLFEPYADKILFLPLQNIPYITNRSHNLAT